MIDAAFSPRLPFQNDQWTVDLDGVEGSLQTGRYFVALGCIDNTTERRGVTFYSLPIHMAEKEWVDIDLFIPAFHHALRWRAKQVGEAVDEAMLTATFQEARLIAEKSRALAEIKSRRYKAEGDLFRVMTFGEATRLHEKDEATLLYSENRR